MNPLLERLMGAIQSPAAQGVAGAALVGANPLLGLVAAPALAQSRRRAEREESAAKLELEARAEELAAARSQREAQAQLPALLNEVAGRQPAGMVGPPPSSGVAQNRLFAALSQSAPAQFTQAAMNRALPQSTRQPADLSLMQSLGFPLTQEGYAQFQAMKNPADPSQSLQDDLARIRIQEALGSIEDRNAAIAEEAEAEERQEAVGTATSVELAEEARTLVEELNELDGSLLSPGSSEGFLDTARSVQGAVASAANAARLPVGRRVDAQNESFDNARKTLARIRNRAIDLVVGEDATNAERAAAAEGFPNMSMASGAIMSGIRSFTENQIRLLEAQGASAETIKPFIDFLEELPDGKPSRYVYDPATGELKPQ